ncbi:MAG: radical SAM protein [bacterium]
MKVLLVNPLRPLRDTYIIPPIHLLYIAQSIRRTGHEAEILDLPYLIDTNSNKFSNDDNSAINYILSKNFDILALGSVVSAYPFCEKLVKETREKKKGIPIIVGGSLGYPIRDLWEKYAPVDYIVESDGELVIEQFMKNYPSNLESIKKIPGLYFLDNNGKYTGNKPELPMNLDYIPFLTYDEIDFEYFSNNLKQMARNILSQEYFEYDEKDRFVSIIFSRGCVYNCSFCFHFNRQHRRHSAKYIVDYIEFLIKKYCATTFYVIDDLIIIDKHWLHEVLDEVIRRKLKVSFFSGGGKPGVVDKLILEKMKQAGWKRLSFGIETGSPLILNIMNKSTTVQDNYTAVSLIREVGIPSTTNIVFGMPKESSKTMDETADFLISLDHNTKQYYASLAVPYPGSPLYDYCTKKGIITDTREYLMNIGGYADYKYNLTDMPMKRFLAKVKDVSYRVDIAYNLKRKNYATVLKLLIMKHIHIIYFITLSADVRMKLRLGLRLQSLKSRLRFVFQKAKN